MKRKVIKQANQAYTITLPIDWVRKNSVDKNPELDVIESGKSLIVNSSNPVAGGSVSIDANELEGREIYLYLNSMYAKGYDEMIFNSRKDISSTLIKATSVLIGLALVSESNGKYVIRDIGGGNHSNLDEIFKRVFQMVLSFYDSAIGDIFGKEDETNQSLDNRDIEVNKFCLYLERAINKMTYSDSINGRVMFTYAFSLERIGDEIHRLWRTNVKYHPKKPKYLKEMMLLSKEALEKSFDLYFQSDLKIMPKIYAVRDKARKLSTSDAKIDAFASRMMRYVVKVAEDATDLCHLTMVRKL